MTSRHRLDKFWGRASRRPTRTRNAETSSPAVPVKTSILVIGGGPAGSTAAALLARNGADVTLIERDVFPRYHIGESLLPSCLELLDLLGIRDQVERYGFVRKPGAYLEWGAERWALDFGELSGECTYSFQVVRSEFDHLLLKNADAKGAKVFEGTKVDHIEFVNGRPGQATWSKGDETGTIAFDYLLDASGRAGLLGAKALKSRRYHQAFQNVAVWGYWKNARRPKASAPGAINVGSLADGWIWGIPLHDGTMSVGLIIHKDAFNAKKPATHDEIYHQALESCPLFRGILGEAELVSPLKIESDYSYTSEKFAAPGYFIAGDAACFIDPLLSSGVHLAMYSGLLAAASLSSLLRGDVSEGEATDFYEKSYRQAYLRFLLFVGTFYDQRKGKEGYFKEAQKLTHEDCDVRSLKAAFLNLVSGLEDMANAEQGIPNLVMAEMSKRLKENLTLRKNKDELRTNRETQVLADNVRFFNAVEGMDALSPQAAVNGWYVATSPRLALARCGKDVGTGPQTVSA